MGFVVKTAAVAIATAIATMAMMVVWWHMTQQKRRSQGGWWWYMMPRRVSFVLTSGSGCHYIAHYHTNP